jgi:hypothetical protein
MGSQEKQNNAFPTFHRPLEISPNTVRFPHSHPTADEKIETLLTDSKKHQLDESVNHVPGLLCQLCPRLHRFRCETRAPLVRDYECPAILNM